MKSTMRFAAQASAYFAFFLVLAAFAFPTQAHELRYIGDGYWIQVGGHIEPPYTHIKNGIDFFPFHEDDPSLGVDGSLSVDKRTGDKVVLEAKGVVVGYDAYDAPIIKTFDLEKKWQIVDLVQDPFVFTQYFQENAFVFNKPTAYGFIVEGYLQRKKPDGTFFKGKHFKEKFICENGTQDTLYGTRFECITDDPNAPITPPAHHDKHIHLDHHE